MTPQDLHNPIERSARVFVDGHVHLHDRFDVQRFFDAASENFASVSSSFESDAPKKYVLCLTETQAANKFEELSKLADAGAAASKDSQARWKFNRTGDERCLVARHPILDDIDIVAGRQIVTRERLEILALGSTERWSDGRPASDVVASTIDAGAIPVLPWGFGKWLGRRNGVVKRLIDKYSDGSMFLGDNSGRPGFIPAPTEFTRARRLGIKILPGSDPLPFASECDRAGSFGFFVDDVTENESIWSGLYAALLQGDASVNGYGALESPLRFIRNQVAMQYLTRVSSKRKAN